MEILTNHTVVVISQCLYVSNHNIVCFKLHDIICQLYLHKGGKNIFLKNVTGYFKLRCTVNEKYTLSFKT